VAAALVGLAPSHRRARARSGSPARTCAGGPAPATEGYYRSFITRDAPSLSRRVAGRRLRLPSRLLHGTREPLGVPLARGIQRHGDDARLELLDGVGHWVPEERPGVVAERIRAMAM